MECNNKHCYWNMFDQCCHESDGGFKYATPNQIDCPSSLRADFQKQLSIIVDECTGLLYFRNMRELIQIKKFIESQRG